MKTKVNNTPDESLTATELLNSLLRPPIPPKSRRRNDSDEIDIGLGQNKGPKQEISKIEGENVDKLDEEFKCGSLCLYLPGFGKGKPVRPNRKEEAPEKHTMISRSVSLGVLGCCYVLGGLVNLSLVSWIAVLA